MKKKESVLEKRWFKITLKVLGIAFAALILLFSALTIVEIGQETYETAPMYLVWVFVFSGLMSVVAFLKERTKMNFLKCIVFLVFNIALGIVILYANKNPFLFSLTTGLYSLAIILKCIFSIIQKRTKRAIAFNLLIIIFAFALAIGLITSPIDNLEEIQNVVIVECVFIAAVSFVEAAIVAFSELKFKILFKIVLKTFALEVLFGLLTMIVCFSFIFMKVEPLVETYPDALWYSFAIVTTIGFGDMYAVTPIGRVLSVFLGIYGIIVVAIITSIIVNFYNETSQKKDQKQIQDIIEEEKGKKKK